MRDCVTLLAESERLYLLQRLLQRALPWLARQQLPTGEFTAYREHAGQSLPFVCPLLSALALDALDCLDPNSDHFHERLFDLIAAPERARVRVAVSTLRWRLRMHLATQQEADGTWRRFGRDGDSPRCCTTTGFALLMYLSQTLQPQRAYASILQRVRAETAGEAMAEVLALRVMSLAGGELAELSPRTLFRIEQETHPMLPLWAAAQACYEGALTCDAAQRAFMLRLALHTLSAQGSFRLHHERAFGLTVLNFCNDGSDAVQRAVDRAIADLLLEPEPPSCWPREPIAFKTGSAPVTLLLVLRSLAQAILAPRPVEAVAC